MPGPAQRPVGPGAAPASPGAAQTPDSRAAEIARGRWYAPMSPQDAGVLRVAAMAVTAAVVVAALYVGRELLVPLALALLLGFVLEPAVVRLKRQGLPRVLAVAVVVSLMLVVLGLAALLLSQQVRSLSAELPRYEATIRGKIRRLNQELTRPGAFAGAARTLESVRREVETAAAPSPAPRIQVEASPPAPLDRVLAWAELFSGPVTRAGIAFVFLVLILLDRQALRDRLLRLLGGDLHRSTDAMDEAGARISKYLLMQLVVNASYGIPMGLGLWLIGVPGAPLWGVVAGLMRFIPFLGPFVAAAFPLTLAFAVDPGWSMFLWTGALIVGLELVSNNLVEPWLYGASTGLSAVSLIVAATFWALLWGPVGLVISTPLTVCLLVFSRHLPGLQFVEVLLGSQPVLDAPTRFYQRLIAGDLEEVVDMAEEQVAAQGLLAFYDQTAIPAMRLASLHHRHAADAEHRHRVLDGLEHVLAELQEEPPDGRAPAAFGAPLVVTLGGKWEIDTLAARMLVHALQSEGIRARVLDGHVSADRFLQELDLQGAAVLCLSVFAREPQAQVRLLSRRLRRRWPDLRIVLAAWSAPADALAPLRGQMVDATVSAMEEALACVRQLVGDPVASAYQPARIPEDEPQRLRALHESGALGEALRLPFNRIARRAADIFDVPIALVTLVDDEWQHVAGSSDAGPEPGPGGATQAGAVASAATAAFRLPRPLSICGQVVFDKRTLVLEDLARDPRFASHPSVQAQGLRFYAGAPLNDPAGRVFGCLCLMDTQPRRLSERESRLLEAMAQDVMDLLFTAPSHGSAPAPAPPPTLETGAATVGQLLPQGGMAPNQKALADE